MRTVKLYLIFFTVFSCQISAFAQNALDDRSTILASSCIAGVKTVNYHNGNRILLLKMMAGSIKCPLPNALGNYLTNYFDETYKDVDADSFLGVKKKYVAGLLARLDMVDVGFFDDEGSYAIDGAIPSYSTPYFYTAKVRCYLHSAFLKGHLSTDNQINCSSKLRNAIAEVVTKNSENIIAFRQSIADITAQNTAQKNNKNQQDKLAVSQGRVKINSLRQNLTTPAKLLNYVFTSGDEGDEGYLWYEDTAKSCMMRSLKVDDQSVIDTPQFNFNDYDPIHLKIISNIINLDLKFGVLAVIQITYKGKILLQTASEGRDITRIKKGLEVIYSKYCRGAKDKTEF
jgi:hypothetical protein